MTGHRPPRVRRRPRPRHRHRPEGSGRERGSVAGVEVLPFGVLVFVVGGLLVVNAWAVIDAKFAASAAAREAAHAYAEAPAGLDTGQAWRAAERAGDGVFAAYGLPAGRTSLAPASSPGLLRCAEVVVEATVRVPTITVPWIGGLGDGITARARQRTLVDPYRSGLNGGGCA